LCKEQQQRHEQDFFRDYGVAEASPDFQAGWSDYMFFFAFFVRFIRSSKISE
jgi:hypothetical protein